MQNKVMTLEQIRWKDRLRNKKHDLHSGQTKRKRSAILQKYFSSHCKNIRENEISNANLIIIFFNLCALSNGINLKIWLKVIRAVFAKSLFIR